MTGIGTLAGGVGLLLLGMRLLTDGLKLAAGHTLESLLRRATASRARSLAVGFGLTAAVQSSSVVTVAAIGFVNAGLLDLSGVLWVVFGSNVGTTVTSWLVSATGLDFDIEALALPMIGVGTLLRLVGRHGRHGALGQALAGFGLFFLGLGVLQQGLGDVAGTLALEPFTLAEGALGWVARVGFILIGVLLTLVMQSSSAAMAVTLSAAVSGVVDLDGAGAMVIGANLGTTSTALLASIGATPMARRAAAGHVVFNLVAAFLALALLPWMLELVQLSLEATIGTPAIAATLAVFHTTFNLAGVILMWPLSDRLVKHLEGRFVSRIEERGKPRHLDETVMAVPAVGLRAAVREMRRLGRHATELIVAILVSSGAGTQAEDVDTDAADTDATDTDATDTDTAAMNGGPIDASAIERDALAIEQLALAVSNFIARMDRQHVSGETARRIQQLLQAWRHYDTVLEQARLLVAARTAMSDEEIEVLKLGGALMTSFRDIVRAAEPDAPDFDIAACDRAVGRMEERFDAFRDEQFSSAAEGTIDVSAALVSQHFMEEARRATRHLARAARVLDSLRAPEVSV